jgi:hypothetical protein
LLKETTETLMSMCWPVFLEVTKASDTVWVKGLLYELTSINFISQLVKIISQYLDCWKYQATNPVSQRVSMVDWNSTASWSDPWYTADVGSPHQSGRKER